jgi:sugar/nucleoside kinase (ribokinase family)
VTRASVATRSGARRAETARLDVVCFGEVGVDLFERRPGVFERHVGGASANLAIALARLGLRVGVVAGIGADPFGEVVRAALAAEGVDTRGLVAAPARTGLVFITRGRGGEPRYLNYRRRTADGALDARDVTAVALRARVGVVASSTFLSPAHARATARFAEALAAAGGALVVDLNVRPALFASKRAQERDARRLVARAALVKASLGDLATFAEGGERWLARHARSPFVVTRGPRPACACVPVPASGRRAFTVVEAPDASARPGPCVDATGGGDAFLAGVLAAFLGSRGGRGRADVPFAAALADRSGWTRALALGHLLGKKAVSRVGGTAGLARLPSLDARRIPR